MRIIGVDEAGRGPLAGPVAVGLVCVPERFNLRKAFPKLNDSKKLTEEAREEIFAALQGYVAAGTICYTVRMKSSEDIETRGIAVVIREAIEDGLEELFADDVRKVWLDGALKAPTAYRQETVIGGDAKIPSIMLASIAAKVTRDRHMVELHEQYPLYGFDRHKGYGTKGHLEALRAHGLCAIHRSSFVHLD
jgi:ribonuclease HII